MSEKIDRPLPLWQNLSDEKLKKEFLNWFLVIPVLVANAVVTLWACHHWLDLCDMFDKGIFYTRIFARGHIAIWLCLILAALVAYIRRNRERAIACCIFLLVSLFTSSGMFGSSFLAISLRTHRLAREAEKAAALQAAAQTNETVQVESAAPAPANP